MNTSYLKSASIELTSAILFHQLFHQFLPFMEYYAYIICISSCINNNAYILCFVHWSWLPISEKKLLLTSFFFSCHHLEAIVLSLKQLNWIALLKASSYLEKKKKKVLFPALCISVLPSKSPAFLLSWYKTQSSRGVLDSQTEHCLLFIWIFRETEI